MTDDSAALATFAGTGEMATLCRAFDWQRHALGPVEDWPASLRTVSALMIAAPFPMAIVWSDSYTLIYNDGYRALLAEKHPLALGAHAKLCCAELWQGSAPIIDRVFAGEGVIVEDAPRGVVRNGSVEDAWFTLGYSPIRDERGDVRGVLMSAFETTATIMARRHIEAAGRAKGDFLSVMTHELRTPLNAIGGYAELLGLGVRGPVTDDQRVDLERIQQSQRQLLDVINGVLSYAKVEAGVVHYAVEDVRMDELLARCEALVARAAREKQIELRHASCGTKLIARADGEKVQQVVLNLLNNAIKFTEAGGRVTLSCAAEEDKRLVVTVADTGCGIATSDLECVFQPFVQVDAKRTRAHEGTGLGLAISRELARGMGGDLTATSSEGEGSVFALVLACGRAGVSDESHARRGGERS